MKQRKTRQPSLKKDPTLKEVFESYDSVTLLALLNTFENSEAWKAFKAYSATVQRQYEVDALDRASRNGESVTTAFASGYAKACEDITQGFMEGLRQTAMNKSPVVENNRVDEPDPLTVYDKQ